MTDFMTGDRVEVATSVLPMGGPALPEGATGTVAAVITSAIDPSRPAYLTIDWDRDDLCGGEWLAERFIPEGSAGLSEALEGDGGGIALPVLSEPVSEALSDSQDPFPVDARVWVLNLGLFARVTDFLPPSADTIYVALDGAGPDPTLVLLKHVVRARVYVSGPMTGYDEFNFPAFDREADRLRAEGWEVENPADKGIVDQWGWEDYLRYDVRVLSDCHAIFTLPNWHESPGANLEMIVAQSLGIEWLNPDGKIPSAAALASRGVAIESAFDFVGSDTVIAQTGEVRKVSSTGGEKGSKPERYDLLPYDALNEVARVYAFGAEKYADHNWRKGYPWHLSIGAAFRHMAAFAMGEDRDPESGLLHPAHAIFHMLGLIAWSLDPEGRYAQFDDRVSTALPQIYAALEGNSLD